MASPEPRRGGPSTSLTVGASGSRTRHRSKTSAGRRWMARRNSLRTNSSGFHGIESVRMRTYCCLSNSDEVKCQEMCDYHIRAGHRISLVILSIIRHSFGRAYRGCQRDWRITALLFSEPRSQLCFGFGSGPRAPRRCTRQSNAFGYRYARSRTNTPILSILVRVKGWRYLRFSTSSSETTATIGLLNASDRRSHTRRSKRLMPMYPAPRSVRALRIPVVEKGSAP